MTKKPVINTISTDVSGLDTSLNENFTNIQDQFENTISRDGSTPNTMTSDFDMNDNDILNVKDLFLERFYINGSLATVSDLTILELDGLATYATRNTVETSATIDPTVSMFYMQGYSSVGDGGGALFKRVGSEPSHEGKVQSFDGAWWEYVPENSGVNVRVFGAVGTNDIATPLVNAVAFALESNFGKVIIPQGDYTWSSVAEITTPEDMEFDARGAYFDCTHNGIALNLNSDYDPAPAIPDTERRITWIGGVFSNSNGTKTASEAIHVEGSRRLVIEKVYIENFWKGIVYASKDTYTFRDVYTFNNVIHFHNFANTIRTADKMIGTIWDRCHVSCNGNTNGILVEESFDLLTISNCIFAGASSAGQVLIKDDALGIPSKNITVFASFFEQQDANGSIVFDATNGNGFENVSIQNSIFSSSTSGVKFIITDDINGFESLKTKYNFGGTADTTEVAITLDADSRNISIEDGVVWDRTPVLFTGWGSSTAVSLNGASRSDIRLIPEFWHVDAGSINDGTNYSPATGLTSSGTVQIDMSAINASLGSNGSVLPPKGYMIKAGANDSNSAGVSIYIGLRLRKFGSGTDTLKTILTGVPNDEEAMVTGIVSCDSNGDIGFIPTASAPGNLDIDLRVMGVYR